MDLSATRECKSERMNEWKNERMNAWMNEVKCGMNEWSDRSNTTAMPSATWKREKGEKKGERDEAANLLYIWALTFNIGQPIFEKLCVDIQYCCEKFNGAT